MTVGGGAEPATMPTGADGYPGGSLNCTIIIDFTKPAKNLFRNFLVVNANSFFLIFQVFIVLHLYRRRVLSSSEVASMFSNNNKIRWHIR